jgi:hypothetical protein
MQIHTLHPPRTTHCGASPQRIRISGAIAGHLRITTASQSTTHVPCSSFASKQPTFSLRAFLPPPLDWQVRLTAPPTVASSSRPRHAPNAPLKTGKQSTCKSMHLQGVGSPAVAQPNLTELPRKVNKRTGLHLLDCPSDHPHHSCSFLYHAQEITYHNSN